MRLIVVVCVVLVCSSGLMAQTENTKKPLKIKAVDKGSNSVGKAPSLLLPKKTTTTNFKISTKKKPDYSPVDPKSRFANPGKVFEKTLKPKGNDRPIEEKFKRNQDLGNYRSNGEFARFICRDHEYVDGDRVQVVLNGEVIFANILLEGRFKGFKVELQQGFNKIDIVALNQGTSGPNTAEFRVYDDEKKLISSNVWNLATGVKATMLIIKD